MKKRQIPHGDEDLICPLHKESMAKVCHACPWWIQLRGNDPNTGEKFDNWNCAIAWGPMLAVNVAREARMGSKATESFRNEVIARRGMPAPVTAAERLLLAGGRT